MDDFYKDLNMEMYGSELREIGADFHDIIDNSIIEDIISEVVNIDWKEEYLNNSNIQNNNICKKITDNEKLIKDTERFSKIREKLLKPINNDKCMARIWNEGYGCQCTSSRINDSMYCKIHHKLVTRDVELNKQSWLGDIDHPYFRYHYNDPSDNEIKWRIGHFPLNIGPKKLEKNDIIMKDIKLVEVDEYKKMDSAENILYVMKI
tara:strand:- start:53 stop:670 length:618 start_codon:yes stop_codon:yes gene_type:complete